MLLMIIREFKSIGLGLRWRLTRLFELCGYPLPASEGLNKTLSFKNYLYQS